MLMPMRWWEWLFGAIFRDLAEKRRIEEARRADAVRRIQEYEARQRAEFEALDRRTYLRYCYGRGAWVPSISPRDRYVIDRAMAIIGVPW